MKHITKMMFGSLVLGLFAIGSFTAAFSRLGSSQPSRAFAEEKEPAPQIQYDADDFASETDANPEELSVSITQSTLTDTSQSLHVIFRSKTIIGFKNGKQTFVVQIDDEHFTGDLDNPAVEGYDHFDEETNLPIFNGVVSFVLGGNNGNQSVYLPSTLTREGSFVIQVTKITSGAVSETGSEYKGNNAWKSGETLKITDIYIPDTIQEVESNAFKDVPATGVTIHVEAASKPAGFADDWAGGSSAVEYSTSSYNKKSNKAANVAYTVKDLPDPYGRPINFILGSYKSDANPGEEYNRPLVMEYDRVVIENGVEKSREKHFDALELTNTVGKSFDSCGNISSLSYARTFGFKIGSNERIDDSSVVFHNIMKAPTTTEIDTSKTYRAKPDIAYSEQLSLDKLVTFKAKMNSTFAGYSMFTLTMDKNLENVSHRYPEPHSLYLDVKTDMYEQNATKINEGTTKIRYTLQNLYNSAYHFQYIGSNGEIKDVTVPIVTKINYLILNNAKGNKISALLKNSDVAPDFKASKVVLFEITNLTVQMDLTTISDSGSVSNLGKSAINFQFAYVTVFNNEKGSAFNWNLFLILFFIGYVIVYIGAAFGVYLFMKEKFKNDEFRRVKGKKFVKNAALGGVGLGVVLAALLFIIMRTTGFKNTIVVFNPTDPLLIAFSIVGLIIIGYFVVYVIKLVKAEKERRKAIRLKLAEDVDEDGTN